MKYIFQTEHPDIPYITRTDTPEDGFGHRSTFATSGCGLASGIMVVDRLLVEQDFSLEDAVKLAVESGANHGPGTDMLIYSKALADKFGLKMVMSNDVNDAIECLRTGGCVIANVRNTEQHKAIFTAGAHYIVLFAYDAEGRFAVLDPSGEKPGKFDEAIANHLVEKVGKIEYVKPEVLDLEAYDPHRYYLFWRG